MRYFVVEIPDSPEDRRIRGVSMHEDPLSDFATYCVSNGLHYKEVAINETAEIYQRLLRKDR